MADFEVTREGPQGPPKEAYSSNGLTRDLHRSTKPSQVHPVFSPFFSQKSASLPKNSNNLVQPETIHFVLQKDHAPEDETHRKDASD